MIKWQDAVEIFKIQLIYQDIYLENCLLLPKHIVEMGKKWIDAKEKKSLILSGPTGCGKTHFAICILRAIIEKGCSWIRYQRGTDLDRELRDGIFDKTEREILQKYSEVSFLFLDDFGVETGSNRLIEQYFPIIDARVGNRLPTIYTTNLDKKGIKSIFGDRISSRLETAMFIPFPEKDLRKSGL